MKIALLGYRSHPHVGGQGIYLHYLSKALSNLGHDVTVFSGQPYPQLHASVKLKKVPGMNLYAEKSPARALKLRNLLSFTDMVEWLSKLSGGFAEPWCFGRRLQIDLKKTLAEFDIIHDNQSLSYGLLALQQTGLNIVATIHHPIHKDRKFAIDSAKDRLHRLLVKRWYSFLKMQENVVEKLPHIITVSNTSKVDIEEHFRCAHTPLKVIPNGVDTDVFKPLSSIKKIRSRIITTASSDQPLKGLCYLIHAVHIVKQTIPDIHLVVIGKQKKSSESAKAIKNLELENSIEFISGISNEQLVEEYARSEIAVCPSLYEGFGMPALEAMACGLPLVSTNGGALPEVIDGAGIIVKAADSDALADAILQLIKSDEQKTKYRDLALTRVTRHFSWEKIASQYIDYYQQVISK